LSEFPQPAQAEVDEHVIDDRPRACHRGARAEAGEAPFGDRRVAQTGGAEPLVEADRRAKVTAARPDPFADNEDQRVTFHLFRQPLERGRSVGHFAHDGSF